VFTGSTTAVSADDAKTICGTAITGAHLLTITATRSSAIDSAESDSQRYYNFDTASNSPYVQYCTGSVCTAGGVFEVLFDGLRSYCCRHLLHFAMSVIQALHPENEYYWLHQPQRPCLPREAKGPPGPLLMHLPPIGCRFCL
jgi:hypothetical protein